MDNQPQKKNWLVDLLDERHLTQADLVRLTGIDSAVISNMCNGFRGVGPKNASKIGKALNLPEEEILRRANVWDRQPGSDPKIEQAIHTLRQLKGRNLDDAIRLLDLRLKVQEEEAEYDARPIEKKASTTK